MRKLLVGAVLVLIAAAAFAQDAPKNNEIYGAVWLDYDLSGVRVSPPTGFPTNPLASDFSFSRMRFGLRNTLVDGVKTWFEFDPRNLEFRQVNVDWAPVAGLDLIAGKQSKFFAQNNDWLFGDRTLGLGAKYAMAGIGWAGIQFGNDADIGNVSSKKLGWEAQASTPIAVTEANPGHVKIYPQITVKPNLGSDYGLEAGVNMEIAADQLGDTNPTGTSFNGYVTASGFGATLTAEYTYTNINDSVTGDQDMVLYTKLAYNAGIVVPTLYFVVDNMTGKNVKAIGSFTNNTTPNATLMIELPINATKDLTVDPFFSYAVSGVNLMYYYAQGYTTGQLSAWPNNDWTAGLRIKYAISSKW